MMQLDAWTFVTILSMALVTYLCRAGGYWLFRQFEPSPGLQSMLSYVPGALFVSFVTPSIVSGGVKEWVGTAVAFIVARVTGSLMWPIFAGTAAAWLVWAIA